jgi:hypothetical protein
MTIDERLEALATHLDVLTRVHEDFEKRTDGRIETLLRMHEDSEKRFAGRLENAVRHARGFRKEVRRDVTCPRGFRKENDGLCG